MSMLCRNRDGCKMTGAAGGGAIRSIDADLAELHLTGGGGLTDSLELLRFGRVGGPTLPLGLPATMPPQLLLEFSTATTFNYEYCSSNALW